VFACKEAHAKSLQTFHESYKTVISEERAAHDAAVADQAVCIDKLRASMTDMCEQIDALVDESQQFEQRLADSQCNMAVISAERDALKCKAESHAAVLVAAESLFGEEPEVLQKVIQWKN